MRYNDYYAVEEQARQKTRKKSREGKTTQSRKPLLTSTSFEKEFNRTTTTNLAELIELTKKKYTVPVVSLYLNFTPERLIRDRKVYLSYFNSLHRESLKREKRMLRSFTHEETVSMKNDIDEIEKYLTQFVDTNGSKSIVIFKSGTTLNTTIQLPIHVQDRMVIDRNPYTSPLEILLQSTPRILVTYIAKDHARLYLTHLGHIQLIHELKSDVPQTRINVARTNKVQKHLLDHLDRHFRKTAEYISASAIEKQWDCLLVVGDEHTITRQFLPYLSHPMSKKLMGTQELSPPHHRNETAEILRVAAEKLAEYQEKKETQAKGILAEAEGHERTANGIEQVLKLHNRRLIKRLFVSMNGPIPGYICASHSYLSVSAGVCGICENKLQPTEDLVDELIEFSNMNTIEVLVFHENPKEIKEFDHIAAITYEATAPEYSQPG